MLRQSAGARPHSLTDVKKEHIVKMCNQKCDAHSTRYVEDVSQSDSADDEMWGLGLYTVTSADQRGSVIKSGCCWRENQSEWK